MSPSFHVAEGNDDFNAFRSLWPKRFGDIERHNSAQRLIQNAFRAGAAILARNKSDNTPLAATVLDLDSYEDALFVPFILISDAISNRAAIQRRMLELILNAFDNSGVSRLLFVTDDTRDHRAAVNDFNEAGAKAGLAAALKIVGAAENLYGDGRGVMFHQLFIPSRERPNLTAQITDAPTASAPNISGPSPGEPTALAARSTLGAAGIGAQVLGDRLMEAACCSGCGEKSKDKEKEKDKEIGGAIIERRSPPGKLNVENTDIFRLYERIAIKRFDRYANDAFSPLV